MVFFFLAKGEKRQIPLWHLPDARGSVAHPWYRYIRNDACYRFAPLADSPGYAPVIPVVENVEMQTVAAQMYPRTIYCEGTLQHGIVYHTVVHVAHTNANSPTSSLTDRSRQDCDEIELSIGQPPCDFVCESAPLYQCMRISITCILVPCMKQAHPSFILPVHKTVLAA